MNVHQTAIGIFLTRVVSCGLLLMRNAMLYVLNCLIVHISRSCLLTIYFADICLLFETKSMNKKRSIETGQIHRGTSPLMRSACEGKVSVVFYDLKTGMYTRRSQIIRSQPGPVAAAQLSQNTV